MSVDGFAKMTKTAKMYVPLVESEALSFYYGLVGVKWEKQNKIIYSGSQNYGLEAKIMPWRPR